MIKKGLAWNSQPLTATRPTEVPQFTEPRGFEKAEQICVRTGYSNPKQQTAPRLSKTVFSYY